MGMANSNQRIQAVQTGIDRRTGILVGTLGVSETAVV